MINELRIVWCKWADGKLADGKWADGNGLMEMGWCNLTD